MRKLRPEISVVKMLCQFCKLSYLNGRFLKKCPRCGNKVKKVDQGKYVTTHVDLGRNNSAVFIEPCDNYTNNVLANYFGGQDKDVREERGLKIAVAGKDEEINAWRIAESELVRILEEIDRGCLKFRIYKLLDGASSSQVKLLFSSKSR